MSDTSDMMVAYDAEIGALSHADYLVWGATAVSANGHFDDVPGLAIHPRKSLDDYANRVASDASGLSAPRISDT